MATEQQTYLQFDQGIRSLQELKPSVAAREPKLWVEYLEVHKDFPTGDMTRLRRIRLRRGLNILWATASHDRRGRLGGHGAGKTTFCRLLRYAIGDTKPGNRQFREAFRAQFPKGWVIADVWLAGERWLVARPLGEMGQHPFTIKGATILEPIPEERSAYRVFEEAVDAAILGAVSERKLSGSGKQLTWPTVLPWLTRDQEAHYSSLIEWRASESDSDSEAPPSAADRANLLRIMLGLVDSNEQQRLRDREKLTQEHERLVRERPQRTYHRNEAKRALEEVFGNAVGLPGELTFEAAVAAKVSALKKEADDAMLEIQDDKELAALVSNEAALTLLVGSVENRVAEITSSINKQKGIVESTSHRASDAQQLAATTSFLPFKGYCSTPLPIARREGCPCVTARPEDDEVSKATKEIIKSAGPERDHLTKLEENLHYYEEDLKQRKKALGDVSQAVRIRRRELGAMLDRRSIPRNKAASIEASHQTWKAAEDNLTKLTSRLEEIEREQETLDRQIEAHAAAHRQQMERFGDLFNLLVQALLSQEVTGKIDLSGGKTLEPKLEFHGSFDSAALNLTKLLAFDLAALAFSQFNDAGHHPRFLLHDSPRESDLAAPVYQSLFLAAQALESACGDQLGFQYLITTTEPPPEGVNKDPWLLDPILDATDATNRFLGVNL